MILLESRGRDFVQPSPTSENGQQMHQYGTNQGYNSGYGANNGYGTTTGYGYNNNRQFNGASTTSLSTLAAIFSAVCAYAIAH
uniref:Uncharacterized protein n=1 Tax=Panagrolaimus sp. PS1159 TaxID=55785 RepID=A0AC35GVP0_9BILA